MPQQTSAQLPACVCGAGRRNEATVIAAIKPRNTRVSRSRDSCMLGTSMELYLWGDYREDGVACQLSWKLLPYWVRNLGFASVTQIDLRSHKVDGRLLVALKVHCGVRILVRLGAPLSLGTDLGVNGALCTWWRTRATGPALRSMRLRVLAWRSFSSIVNRIQHPPFPIRILPRRGAIHRARSPFLAPFRRLSRGPAPLFPGPAGVYLGV